MFENLLRAAVGVVVTPVALAADVATLGGSLNERSSTYTGSVLGNVWKNLEEATQ